MTDFFADSVAAERAWRDEQQAQRDAEFTKVGAAAHAYWRGLADTLAELVPPSDKMPGRHTPTDDGIDYRPVTSSARWQKITGLMRRAVELADTIAADYRRELASMGVTVDRPERVDSEGGAS